MNKIRNLIEKLFAPQFIFLWILLLLVIFFAVKSPTFRKAENLLEIIRASVINAILVMGLTWIVASGEIDVTFPDIAALSSMITALCITNGLPWWLSIVIAMGICSLYGLTSSFLINVFKFQSLIATIGIAVLAKSTAYIIGKGGPIYLTRIDKTVQFIVFGKFAGFIPVLMVIVLLIYLAASFLQNQTKLGQYLYALGENRVVVREAGIPEKKIIYSFFLLSAVFASLGGIVLLASFTSGQPNLAGSYFVDGLTAVFLGALVIKSGKPNVIGTLIGAIFIMVLGNGSTLLNIPFYYGVIIKGVLMVISVYVIAITKRKVSIKRGKVQVK
ncbi:MAG TPA: ABC transporter permease [Anaerolineae bacterium]|nr:ABC transporter permease [Anaerolineae bacterium]